MVELIDKWGDQCDNLHTDLHECLGHGSGKLLDGVSPDALKSYGSTIEEARADLFGLYFIADPKLLQLGLLDNSEAYHAAYYSYMLNGLMTQLVRIAPGNKIEEAHMRNRALIARWCYEKGKKNSVAVETYGVNVDEKLHKEVLDRYARLDLAPYKGFLNPKLTPVTDDRGDVKDILVDYSEDYDQQMMRYGKEYGAL